MKRLREISVVAGLLGIITFCGFQGSVFAQTRTPVVVIPFDSAAATKPKEPANAVAIFRRDRTTNEPQHRENPIRLMRSEIDDELFSDTTFPDFDPGAENLKLSGEIEEAITEDEIDGTIDEYEDTSEIDDLLDNTLQIGPRVPQNAYPKGEMIEDILDDYPDDETEYEPDDEGLSFEERLKQYHTNVGGLGGTQNATDTQKPPVVRPEGKSSEEQRKPVIEIPPVKPVEPIKPTPPPVRPVFPPKHEPEKVETPIRADDTTQIDGYKPQIFTRKHTKMNGCAIGPQFGFRGDYGYCTEFAPFAGFFIENPGTPVFDMGIGACGTDFYGYPKMGCNPVRPYGWLFDNMEVFVGVNGFGNRSGLIDEKSFGIHEGVNWAGTVSPLFGVSGQFGVRAIQRTVDGFHPEFETPEWDSSGKAQVFITAGLFKRSNYHRLQYGFVYDWMSDSKYKDKELIDKSINLGQIRTELSYRCNYGWTFGVRGAFGTTQDDPFEKPEYKIRVASQLLGFFEKELWCGNSVQFSAGGSGAGNAILSAGYYQPINDKLSFQTGFSYMLGKEKEVDGNFADKDRDAWGAVFTLTFHPHGGAFSRGCNTGRAMFDVADNGSMFIYHKK